jgi:hypothetical protein
LTKNSKKLINQFLQNFIKPQILETADTNVFLIHPDNYVSLDEIFVGYECKNYIHSNLDATDQKSVMLKILDFYITLAKEMITRLPVSGIYHEFEFLCPEIVFDKNRKKLSELPELCAKYKKFLDVNAALNEWRILPFAFDCDAVSVIAKLPLDEMWMKISQYKDFTGCFKFRNISKLASIVLTLPHSNAEAERLFSVVNDIKTKKRNRLGDNTLNAMCSIRSSFTSLNIDCTKFKPTDDHIKLFTNGIYCDKE